MPSGRPTRLYGTERLGQGSSGGVCTGRRRVRIGELAYRANPDKQENVNKMRLATSGVGIVI